LTPQAGIYLACGISFVLLTLVYAHKATGIFIAADTGDKSGATQYVEFLVSKIINSSDTCRISSTVDVLITEPLW
jgi:hypothetical protein